MPSEGNVPDREELAVLEAEDGMATLTITRPKALNALNSQVLDAIDAAIERVRADASIGCLVITGSGEKAFVAGADIAEMRSMDHKEAYEFSRRGQRTFEAISALPIPVIAAIRGYALGGGLELALACDIRIAAEDAKLGQPETGLGITPGFGATQRLARLVGPARAKELIFTGERISGLEAAAIGLVNKAVPADRVLEEAKDMARKCLASKSRLAQAMAKAAIDEGLEASLAEGLKIEARRFARCFEAGDAAEGMAAFLEKRPPAFSALRPVHER